MTSSRGCLGRLDVQAAPAAHCLLGDFDVMLGAEPEGDVSERVAVLAGLGEVGGEPAGDDAVDQFGGVGWGHEPFLPPMIGTVNPQRTALCFPHGVDNYVGRWYNLRMARHPRNEMAVAQFGVRVARLAKKHPATPKDIELWAYSHLGLRVGEESIRKALKGEVDPTQCAGELLMVLAAFYGVEPSALGHHAERRMQPFLTWAGKRGPDEPPQQGSGPTACNDRTRSPFLTSERDPKGASSTSLPLRRRSA